MASAFVATLANPTWWTIALAAFLVRGGLLLILLPLITLPTTASLTTDFAPVLETLLLGRSSLAGFAMMLALAGGIVVAVAAAGLAGSWLDLALVREAAADEDVDLPWRPVNGSIREAFSIRLTAHLPTLAALAYAAVRLVTVGYEEFTSPGDSGMPVALRIISRAPEALVLVVLAWLLGETVGSLAARRAAIGLGRSAALRESVGQVLRPRGLATLAITSAALIGVWLPFEGTVRPAWEHIRAYLLDSAPSVPLAAALVLLISTYVLGLAVVGAALAWRATAWTAEVAPPPVLDRGLPLGPAEAAGPEIARG
jgi:hypothetical protein